MNVLKFYLLSILWCLNYFLFNLFTEENDLGNKIISFMNSDLKKNI